MNQISELKKTVIDNGYCIGCGACSFASDGKIKIELNSNGQLQAVITNYEDDTDNISVLNVCPFYNERNNEDYFGKKIYSNIDGIKHDRYIGYNLVNYAGYVKTGEYRKNGSSGGFGTWIASKLLDEGLVDKVIHVKSKHNKDLLFDYQVSSSVSEIQEGSKSRYYPIEMSEVLEYVSNNDYRYLIVGLPCFIKAVRQLQEQYSILNSRIKFTLGLVCGHLKSEFFAKSMAWELGIHPSDLKEIDFRVKNTDKSANNYSIKASGVIDDELIDFELPTKDLFVSNWGHGLFKYKACDYCDDVMAETADVTIGDAWLPKYSKDSFGTNIITIRDQTIKTLFIKYQHEISVDLISSSDVYQSQAGGFRHRRDGLGYRLYLANQKGLWVPHKRVNPSSKVSRKRKMIYEKRIELIQKSYTAYHNAIQKNDFSIIPNELNPLIDDYDDLYKKNILVTTILKIIKKLKQMFKI